MSDLAKQRYNRIAQANWRGGSSIKTELENVYLLLAWEAGLLSEGQVAKALGTDRVALRIMRETSLSHALRIGDRLLHKGKRP